MVESRAVTQHNSQHSNISADDRAVAGLIARLLLHFFTPQDLPDGARKAMAEDWLVDLREFGPDIVANACGEWRRSNAKRPAIADIRLLCIAAQQEHRERHVDEQAYLPPQDARAAREMRHRERERRGRQDQLEGRAKVNEWAQRRGYADLDAYAEAKGMRIEDAYGEVIKEILAGSPLATSISTAVSLGVKVRECTPEEMRAGRVALGLEDADLDEPRAAE